MSEQNLTLANAVRIAAEAEKQAVDFYRDAAQKMSNVVIQRLFNSLADFEQHHYDKVTELTLSLQKKGKFLFYEGCSPPIPAQSEIEMSQETADALAKSKMSMMEVITLAQKVEQQADKRYAALAGQTSDPDGKAMFERLAKEEQSHLRLLTEVYWNLNDRGVLSWSSG
jgi:rubrerythrin